MITTSVIDAFLARHLTSYEIVGPAEPLQGGLINLVWRVPARPASIIVKHAPPYIATAPEIPFKSVRQLFEARSLETIGAGGVLAFITRENCRPPELLAHDEDARLIAVEDLGAHTPLHTWLLGQPADTAAGGAALGGFIGRLHRESSSRPHLALRHANLPVQETRLAVQYQAIEALCRKAGIEDADVLGERARDLGKRLLYPGACIVMGDLWPHSILITPAGVRLIDWEFSHFGSPMQDVAHLAAHTWMLAHRHPEARMSVDAFWRSFLNAYRTEIAPVQALLWNARCCEDGALHFGAEILMRTLGGFKEGYLYTDLNQDDGSIREAVNVAARHLRDPEDTDLFQIFCPRG